MDKDRQDGTMIKGFVSRHRKGERGDREAGGKGGRRDRYGNPVEKGGKVARKRQGHENREG